MQKSTLFGLVVLVTILFASCEKNLYDPSQTPDQELTIADLVVPTDFNWELSQQVTCTVNTQLASPISIYTDEAIPEEFLAKFTAEPNDEAIVLSIPTATKTLYLQYETVAGVKKSISALVKEDKTVTFTLPSDSKAPAQTRATTRDGNGNALFTYPANWGTILFEDMFPQIGDYDFNDFVAKYQIGLTGTGANGNHRISNMRVSMYVYAIGGTLPYTPYFRLVGIDKNDIDLSSVRILGSILNNPTPGVEIKVVEVPNSNELVVQYINATNNPHKVIGSSFLNTEPNFITRISETTQISFEFNFKNAKIQAKNLQEPAIDFFLANENRSKEIHLRGYKSVFNEYSHGSGLGSNATYSTDGNLIWAMKIPATVRHIYERKNFRTAYTHFATWAQSGGKEYNDWYDRTKQGYHDASLTIKWK